MCLGTKETNFCSFEKNISVSLFSNELNVLRGGTCLDCRQSGLLPGLFYYKAMLLIFVCNVVCCCLPKIIMVFSEKYDAWMLAKIET